jgi:zinc protease
MERSFAATLAVVVCLTCPCRSQTAESYAVPKITFEHYKLPNGLQVIFHVNRKAPVVHLNLRYGVGAKHERPGRSGFAHLFEHMLGQGVDPGADYGVLADRIGATEVSGSVAHDYTEFYETIPSHRLQRMLWLESNRFVKLPGALTQQNFDKQREIVKNERRQKVENRPYGRLNGLVHQHGFPAGHPYDHDAIGSYEDLEAATLDDVREFYKTYYTPENLTLVLAGDFETGQAKEWIEKYYGSLPPGEGIARPARWTPKLTAPKTVEVQDRLPLERVFISWPAPGILEPGDSALELAAFILNDGGRRLNAALTRGEALCSDLQIDTYRLQDASMFVVIAAPRPGVPVSKIEEVIAAEIVRLASEGPADEELARAKNNLEFRQLSGLETLHGIASALNQINLIYGDPGHFSEWAGRYSKVTAEDVRAAARLWLDTPNRLVIRFRPVTATRGSMQQLDRNQPPPFEAPKPYRPPAVKSAKLANGMQVFVEERPDLPSVSVEMRFRIGIAHNPPGKEGLALVTLGAAKRGTQTRSGEHIEREVTNMATSLEAGADVESISTGFSILRRHLDPALELLSDVIRNPAYSHRAVESEKKTWLDHIRQMENRSDGFEVAAMSIMLGRAHPFGTSLFPSRRSLEAIAAADVEAFHRKYIKPDVAALVFVGDITLDQAVELTNKFFRDWTGTSQKPRAIPPPQAMPGRFFLIDRKNAPQTLIVQMLSGIIRRSPEYAALTLADKVWGGMFSSRLMQNIRQEKGYAYEAGSQIWAFSSFGFWLAKSPVQTDKTVEALTEFVKELRGLGGEKPITEAELESAKANVIQSYPGQFERASSTADHISRLWSMGVPVSDIQSWPQIVKNTSLESVNAIARRYARPEKQVFLFIGDRSKIETGVRKLNLGELVVLNHDGSIADTR